MCHTTVPEDMPLTTTGQGLSPDSGAPPNLNEGVPGYDANAVNAIAGDNGAPKSVSVSKPTKFGRLAEIASLGTYDPAGDMQPASPSHKLTKFGVLMQVLQPALEGGIIGLAGGKGTPGGGFNAANEFFMRRNALNFQRAMLERQFANDQFRNLLEYARTQHTLNQPYFTGRGAIPIRGVDASGNPIFMRPNPYTGAYEPVPGLVPEEPAGKPMMFDEGAAVVNPRTGVATPVTMGQQGPAQVASFGNTAPSRFDSGSPRLPGSPSQSPAGIAALHPPGFGKPRPVIRASRNAAGGETDSIYDENPTSPTFGKRIGSLGNFRAPLPDRSNSTAGAKNDLNSWIEQFAAEALNKKGGDPNKAIDYINNLKTGDPESDKLLRAHLGDIRRRIRDRSRRTRTQLKLSPEDQAAAGITPSQNSSVSNDDNDEQ